MSLILMSVMIFFIENIFHSFLPERRRIALPKRTREKIRIFALIADFLLLAALGVRFFLSRVEPLIILFLVNVEEITSIEEVRAVFESLRSSLSVMITPSSARVYISLDFLSRKRMMRISPKRFHNPS